MAGQMYTRVEFTADIGFEPFVIAFVDFSAQGISFGAPPYNTQIYEGAPEDESSKLAISEYQRVTVHADGKVETHLPTSTPPAELKEIDQPTPPLAQWTGLWGRRFEFTWSSDHLAFMKPWLTKPKPYGHSKCLTVPVEFSPNAVSTVTYVHVVSPGMDMDDIASLVPFDGQMWFLNGGWPYVLVKMSNVKCLGIDELRTVGRDYR